MLSGQQSAIASMTGFARQEGGDGSTTWAWEVKSVNGRSLDVRCRVPNGYETLEAAARSALAEHCKRGNIQLGLIVNREAAPVTLQINRELLDQILETVQNLGGRVEAQPPSLDGLLALRGVMDVVEQEDSEEAVEARRLAMQADLGLALEALVDMRRAEGGRLGDLAKQHLDAIESLVEKAGSTAATQPESLRQRFETQIEELLQGVPALPEDRLAQEVALLIAKADVREELDRLRAHIEAARELLAQGGAVGRKLDFLCQEFNRESNTLCSKSADVALTRIGLDLKSTVEQLREQIQNIE